jgi:hypothetical protein
LDLDPFFDAIVLDVFEIGSHRPMMRTLISHEIMKFFARVIAAMTAEVKMSGPGARSEFALFYPIVDIITEATITICRSACTAKETTSPAF